MAMLKQPKGIGDQAVRNSKEESNNEGVGNAVINGIHQET